MRAVMRVEHVDGIGVAGSVCDEDHDLLLDEEALDDVPIALGKA